MDRQTAEHIVKIANDISTPVNELTRISLDGLTNEAGKELRLHVSEIMLALDAILRQIEHEFPDLGVP